MLSELENLVKKNLKLDYVKSLDRILYSVEYEGKLYSEAVPIKEFLKSCQSWTPFFYLRNKNNSRAKKNRQKYSCPSRLN